MDSPTRRALEFQAMDFATAMIPFFAAIASLACGVVAVIIGLIDFFSELVRPGNSRVAWGFFEITCGLLLILGIDGLLSIDLNNFDVFSIRFSAGSTLMLVIASLIRLTQTRQRVATAFILCFGSINLYVLWDFFRLLSDRSN